MYLRNRCLISHEGVSLCLLLRGKPKYIWSHIFDPSWVNFCIWCEVRLPLQSFACGPPVVPTQVVQSPFFPCCIVLAFLLAVDHRYMDLFPDSQLCSTNLYDYSWLLCFVVIFFFFFFSSTSLLLPTHLPPPLCTHAQSCNPMDCSPPSSSVHGLFQTRILEWVAISFSSSNFFYFNFFSFHLFLLVGG